MIYGMSEFEDRLREIAKEISRTVERKKYGRAKARRSFQFSKR